MNTILSHVRPKSVSATPLRANKISFASPLRAAFTAAAFCIPTAATLCLPSATTVCAAEISTQEKALNELKARENGTLDLTNESTKKLLKETLGLDDSRFHKDIRYALVDLKAPNNKFTKHIIYLYLDIDGKAISGVKDLLDLKNVKDNWKIYSTSPELESTLNTLTRDIWRTRAAQTSLQLGAETSSTLDQIIDNAIVDQNYGANIEEAKKIKEALRKWPEKIIRDLLGTWGVKINLINANKRLDRESVSKLTSQNIDDFLKMGSANYNNSNERDKRIHGGVINMNLHRSNKILEADFNHELGHALGQRIAVLWDDNPELMRRVGFDPAVWSRSSSDFGSVNPVFMTDHLQLKAIHDSDVEQIARDFHNKNGVFSDEHILAVSAKNIHLPFQRKYLAQTMSYHSRSFDTASHDNPQLGISNGKGAYEAAAEACAFSLGDTLLRPYWMGAFPRTTEKVRDIVSSVYGVELKANTQ